MIIYYNKGEIKQLSPNFSLHEFECPCSDCKQTILDNELIKKLESMRGILGSKLTITSGYRCPNYQQQLRLRGYETAKGPSTHSQGKAADITNGVSLGGELEEAARKAGFESVGVGRNWCHVDLRPGFRRWLYSSSKR